MVPTLNLIFVHIVLVCLLSFFPLFFIHPNKIVRHFEPLSISYLGHFNRTYPPARRVSSRPSDRYDFVRPHTHTTRTRTFSTNSVVVFIYSRSVLATLAQIEDVPTQIKTFYLRECAHFQHCALEFWTCVITFFARFCDVLGLVEKGVQGCFQKFVTPFICR